MALLMLGVAANGERAAATTLPIVGEGVVMERLVCRAVVIERDRIGKGCMELGRARPLARLPGCSVVMGRPGAAAAAAVAMPESIACSLLAQAANIWAYVGGENM